MTPRHLAALAAALAAATAARGDDPVPDRPVSFRADVAPILVRSCLGCHDERKAESGLNLTTYARLREGGETLAEGIVEPGDPDASYLIELVRPDANPRMPLKQDPLTADEIATLERWVREGAAFDGPSESETPITSLVDPLANLPTIALKVPVAEPVAALAYSADGSLLAAAQGSDVVVFDASSGRPSATLADHPGPVKAVRFTPDGRSLIAAGGRAGMFGSVVVWDLASKTRTHDFRGHTDQVLAIDLAPDGRTLVTGSYDWLAKVWDVVEGTELRTLREHTDAIYGVAISPDGDSVATASGDRTAKVWDVASGRKRASLSDATAEVYAVAFAPDGGTVFVAGVDRSIRAYRLEGDAATLARSAFAHDAAVMRLVVGPDGRTLFTAGEDRAVKLWDVATLRPLAALGGQPDWPLAVAVSADGGKAAVGRYDGSLAIYDAKTRQPLVAIREAPKPEPPRPELVRGASLNPPSPRGAPRGRTVKVTLSGIGVGRAEAILFPEPGIAARLLPREKAEPNLIDAELTVDPAARVGLHRFLVRTPMGTPPAQSFAVSAYEERPEVEPNDDPSRAPTVTLPATLTGAIERAGEVDHVRFEAMAGQTLVFETLASGLGSGLNGLLTLLDDSGRVVAESAGSDGELDPLLIAAIPRRGIYTLRISDVDLGGSGNHIYRIHAGAFPYVRSVFPLSFAPLGDLEGGGARVGVSGVNLGGIDSADFPIGTGGSVTPWEIREVPIVLPDGSRPLNRALVLTDPGARTLEAEDNDAPERANPLLAPGGVSGRIGSPGDADHFRFEAREGQALAVEVFGRRLGTPIDPVLEILDASGKPVPRAVLRPVEETAVQFRDHPSTGRNVRLTWPWDGFAVGDTILVGREVTRLHELPRNPDDDSVWWGLGHPRNNSGERIAFLGTTPEHHPMGQPIYKVEVHPPGATFPAGGVPPVTVYHRNDDGGPGFDKDSILLFDPPADGTYIARVEDVRGLGGERFGYHMVVRPARPDFAVSLQTSNPNIPRGGAVAVPVEVRRIDGYRGPVEVWVEGLPTGITATSAVIEEDQYVADLLFMADDSAPPFPGGNWIVKARAQIGESPSDVVEHTLDPGGPSGGWITVTPEPNLMVTFRPERVVIRPGETVEMTLAVERRNGFRGRVPIDVRNLPFGVRVLHIGLNGVLVTEDQIERSIFLYAEPWVRPMERPFYAVAKCEPAGTDEGSPPIPLVVLPASGGPRESSDSPPAPPVGAPR